MTLDELRLKLREICGEASHSVWPMMDEVARKRAREKLEALFSEHREEVFEISHPVGQSWPTYPDGYFAKWSQFEKEIRQNMPDVYSTLQRNAIAFFTCSCGSREDSCAEDGDGNFSTFIFMPDGEVFRRVEKKQ